MKEELYLVDMYRDDYYPNFLVDRIKSYLQTAEQIIQHHSEDLVRVQQALDVAVSSINDLAETFYAHNSEIEMVAREDIAETVMTMLDYYSITLDIEEALRERDW